MQPTKKKLLNVAELRLTYKPPKTAIFLTKSEEVEAVLRSVWDSKLLPIQEQFYVLYLNRRSELISWRCLHTGTTASALMDIKLLLATAFGCLAQSLIIAHNHPSGSLKPSPADIRLTTRIYQSCKDYEIELLDHLILTDCGYMSFADEGIM